MHSHERLLFLDNATPFLGKEKVNPLDHSDSLHSQLTCSQ